MNTYVIRTHMSEDELNRVIREIDRDSFVDIMEDVVMLSQPMNDSPQIMLVNMPNNERMKLDPLPTHVLNWANVNEDACPCCTASLQEQETDYMNGYCNKCGLSWSEKEVWFECNTLEDDSAVGKP